MKSTTWVRKKYYYNLWNSTTKKRVKILLESEHNTTLNNGKYYSSMQLVCNAWKHTNNFLCSGNYYYSIICTTSILDIAPTDVVVGKMFFSHHYLLIVPVKCLKVDKLELKTCPTYLVSVRFGIDWPRNEATVSTHTKYVREIRGEENA